MHVNVIKEKKNLGPLSFVSQQPLYAFLFLFFLLIMTTLVCSNVVFFFFLVERFASIESQIS